MDGRLVNERTYMAVETARKEALAQLIRESGLPYSHIAKETGVERRAVKRAADGEGIRFDTATRIEYFLEYYNEINNDNNRK